jgi:hypothetical protein
VRQESGQEIDGAECAGIFPQSIAFFLVLVRFTHKNATVTVGSSRCSSLRILSWA